MFKAFFDALILKGFAMLLLEGFQSAFCVDSTLSELILPLYSALGRSYLEFWV